MQLKDITALKIRYSSAACVNGKVTVGSDNQAYDASSHTCEFESIFSGTCLHE